MLPSQVMVPLTWQSSPVQTESYRSGYLEALEGVCDAEAWVKRRGRSRLAYESGREAGAALRASLNPSV